MSKKATNLTRAPHAKRQNSTAPRQRREPSQSFDSPIDCVLFLQRTIGNRAVQRLFKSAGIHAQPKSNQRADISKQETDQIADQVMRSPELESQGDSSKLAQVSPESVLGRVPWLRASGQLGRMLPLTLLTHAEQRLGQPLGHTRLHDDASGRMVALMMGARAVTVGRHIFTAPNQVNDTSLMLHELTHVATQDPSLGVHRGLVPSTHSAEKVANDVSMGSSPVLHPVPIGAFRTPMPLAQFQREMERFQVQIRVGTCDDQVRYLQQVNQPVVASLLQVDPSVWQAWDPGPDSQVYDQIFQTFEGFEGRIGGIPSVNELIFFRTAYELNSEGGLEADPTTKGSYSGGTLTLYRRAYDDRVIPVTIAHELGHGLQEVAMGGATPPSPQLLQAFQLHVGWTLGNPPRLYDIGVELVRSTLARDTEHAPSDGDPIGQYRITRANWIRPWIDKPVSERAFESPSEDFCETAAYYVVHRNVLEQLSPRRLEFFDRHLSSLHPHLRRRSPSP